MPTRGFKPTNYDSVGVSFTPPTHARFAGSEKFWSGFWEVGIMILKVKLQRNNVLWSDNINKKICYVVYHQTYWCKKVSITFFPRGHIFTQLRLLYHLFQKNFTAFSNFIYQNWYSLIILIVFLKCMSSYLHISTCGLFSTLSNSSCSWYFW